MNFKLKLLLLLFVGSAVVFAGCTFNQEPIIEDDQAPINESEDEEIEDLITEDVIEEEDDIELGELI